MKPPEKIKKGMKLCKPIWKGDHWKTCDEKCPYRNEGSLCREMLNSDALALIQQLEAENAELKRERDAALADFKCYRDRNIKREYGVYACDMCKHGGDPYDERTFEKPCPKGCEGYKHWEWRGPCEENRGQKEEEK